MTQQQQEYRIDIVNIDHNAHRKQVFSRARVNLCTHARNTTVVRVTICVRTSTYRCEQLSFYHIVDFSSESLCKKSFLTLWMLLFKELSSVPIARNYMSQKLGNYKPAKRMHDHYFYPNDHLCHIYVKNNAFLHIANNPHMKIELVSHAYRTSAILIIK